MADKDKKNIGTIDWRTLYRSLRLTGHRHLLRNYGFDRTISVLVEENSIQLAAVQKYWHTCRLLDVTKIYLPPSLDSAEKRQNFLTGEIDTYLRQHKGLRTCFVIGVGGSESAVRIINLPHMAGAELRKAVYWAGNKQIPFSLDDAYFGYHIVDSTKIGDKDSIDTSLIAVSRKEVRRRLDQIRAGIEIEAVYHELEAIGFLLQNLPEFSPEKTFTLINIKKNHSEISFFRGARLEFQHISSLGTAAISAELNKSEQYDEFTDNIASEIQNSLDYYAGQFSRLTTDTVYIYGDLSYSEELIDHLTDRFGIEFKRFPVNGIPGPKNNPAPLADQIPVCLSAVALAMVNDDVINFLPPDIREERAKISFTRRAVPALAFLILLLLASWISFRQQVESKQFHLLQINNEIEKFVQSPAYITYEKIQRHLIADKNLMEKLTHQPTFLNLNLKELSLLTPEKIRLDYYDLGTAGNRFSLALNGEAYSSGQPPEVTLAEYIARLEGSPFFGQVALKRYNKRAAGDSFIIDFQIEMEAYI